MTISRRRLLARAGYLAAASSPLLLSAGVAHADTAQYFYDPLGRLVRVMLSDGSIIVYVYDAAGNRTRMARSDGSPFVQTVQITGTGPVNLRALADQAGYTGYTGATLTFQLGSAVTIIGAPGTYAAGPALPTAGGPGIDTGLWPSSSYAISLALEISGKVYGGGGSGAGGGEGAGGNPGTAGGDAIYAREHINVTVNATGQVKGGGGGGGGGGSWLRTVGDEESYWEGGGGGGGFPNGTASPFGVNPGSPGTLSGGGAGGPGTSAAGGRVTGAGGVGGGAASAGANGGTPTGASGPGSGGAIWTPTSPGVGGAAGFAIRKNGKTVNVTTNPGGVISGAVG
jgi:YD repeat-containing protein